jgi:predicted ATPase
MLDMVLAAADGNPLFLEELIAALIDRRILERTGDTWTVRELPAGFTLPDSIQAVIAARIDLLPPADKMALQAASVIGRVFWSGPVYELLGAGDPDFRLLEERQFIRRLSTTSIPGQREFLFKHALTRQVAYNSLPKVRRARSHAEFAEWLEAATDRDDHAALVAHHYTEAVRPDVTDLAWPDAERLADLEAKAARWLQRAAVLAISRYAIDDGLALLERAAEFTLPKDVESDVWRAIGRAHAAIRGGNT